MHTVALHLYCKYGVNLLCNLVAVNYLPAGVVVPQVHESFLCLPVLLGVDELPRELVTEVDVVGAAAPDVLTLRLTLAHLPVARADLELALGAGLGDGMHHAGRRYAVNVGLLTAVCVGRRR